MRRIPRIVLPQRGGAHEAAALPTAYWPNAIEPMSTLVPRVYSAGLAAVS